MTHWGSFQVIYFARNIFSELGKWLVVSFTPSLHCHLAPSNLGLEWLCWRRVGRGNRQRLDPSRPHVGKKLVGDLGQDVLGEAGHAQDVVPCTVDVISEWDKLGEESKLFYNGRQKIPNAEVTKAHKHRNSGQIATPSNEDAFRWMNKYKIRNRLFDFLPAGNI